MHLDPAVLKVDDGQFTLAVVVDDVSDAGAIEFDVDFDRRFVKLVDIRKGPFLGSTNRQVVCRQDARPEGPVSFGCNTEGSAPSGPAGSGVVAYLDFAVQGRAFGLTHILLMSCEAADVLGTSLLSDKCRDTKLTVNAPTATATPNLGIRKSPAMQNLFLTRQGAKIPPLRCLGSTDIAYVKESLTRSVSSPDPKNPANRQQLGAFEFEVRFDPKLFCVEVRPGPAAANMQCFIDDATNAVLEGIARLGCVLKGKTGFPDTDLKAGRHLADLLVRPQPELYSIIRPNQENGIVAQLLDLNCELADTQGHPIRLFSCEDADLTVRYLEGDVEPNCRVDAADQQNVAFRWGAGFGSLLYNTRFDLEPSGVVKGDGDIDVKDLQFVLGRFGSTCEHPHPPQLPLNPKGGQTPTPTITPTPTVPNTPQPRVNKFPNERELVLTAPPAATCEEMQDSVTFEVLVKDEITSPDPKATELLQQLGAFEFETSFDASLICIEITPGEIPSGEMVCFANQAEGFVHYGCTTKSDAPTPVPQPPGVLAIITVRPQPKAYELLNTVAKDLKTGLVNEACELADLFGHPIKQKGCTGANVTIHFPAH
jgi:hypothetical protein